MNEFEQIQLTDYVKRKRRRAFFWGAGVTAIVACLVWGVGGAGEPSFPHQGDHIARIKVEGGIFDDELRQEMIDEIAMREDVKALIVEIDSPGGAIYPSYLMYERIKEISGGIPTVAVMEGYAASGGLMVAMGTEYVVASPVTVTGSIGVIGEMQDFAGLMEKIGIGNTVFRTSDVKGGPSPFRKPTQAEIASVNTELNDMLDVFKDLVADSRDLSTSEIDAIANGEVFIGQKAVDNKLVDELGGGNEATAYLEAQYPELEELEIVDWEPLYEPEVSGGLFQQMANATIEAVKKEIKSKQYDGVQY